MLKEFIYIIIGLFVVFVLVNGGWRYFRKKKKDAAKRVRYEDPKYIDLDREKDAIKRKRAELELDHPYQKLLSLRLKVKKAHDAGDEAAEVEYLEAIERIRAEYDDVSEEQLRKAYHAQLAAMSRRLSQIEIEQRHIIIEAEKLI